MCLLSLLMVVSQFERVKQLYCGGNSLLQQSYYLYSFSENLVRMSFVQDNYLRIVFIFSLPSIQKIRPQRRNKAASRNPLKTLAQREDLSNTYTEVKTNIAEKEMTRIKKEQSKNLSIIISLYLSFHIIRVCGNHLILTIKLL